MRKLYPRTYIGRVFGATALSTKITIFMWFNKDTGDKIHVFEDVGFNSHRSPGFFLYAFEAGQTDVLIRIPEEVAKSFYKMKGCHE